MKVNPKYICKYCGKECKNANSLSQHQVRCKENPDRIHVVSNFIKYNNDLRTGVKQSWCRGLTKEADDRLKKRTDTMISNYQEGKNNIGWCKGLSKDTDERLRDIGNKVRKTITDKIVDDTWHNCRSKKYYYEDISFDSNWELYFYKYVKSLGYDIKRGKEYFSYIYNNEEHLYIPDFYISDLDLYIEIKSYPNERDIAKWNQFPKALNIYFGHNLRALGVEELQNYRESPERIEKYEKAVPEKYKERIKL